MVGAVILPPGWLPDGLRDSKILKADARERLAEQILRHAVAWAVAAVEPAVIDRVNILQATLLASSSRRAACPVRPDALLLDGSLHLDEISLPQRVVVDGDRLCASIAAASILAKVARDRLMVELDGRFPGYDLAHNKGYAAPEHRAGLREHGTTSIHRLTFASCADVEQTVLWEAVGPGDDEVADIEPTTTLGGGSAARPSPPDKSPVIGGRHARPMAGVRTPQQLAGDEAERAVASHLVASGWRILGSARPGRPGRARPRRDRPGTAAMPSWSSRSAGGATASFGLPEETFDRRKRAHLRRAVGATGGGGRAPRRSPLPALPVRVDLVAVEPPRAPATRRASATTEPRSRTEPGWSAPGIDLASRELDRPGRGPPR